MNKLLVLGLTSVLSLAFLVACGGNESEALNGMDEVDALVGDGEETTFGGETVTLWLDDEIYADALVVALEEEFPETTFVFEEVESVDVLDMLMLDGPAGIGGDIMLLPHDTIGDGIRQNLFLPLGSALEDAMNGRIQESALGTVRHNDHYFGVPLTTESVALFYNSTLLEARGLSVAQTFEELIEQAETFNDPGANEFIIRWEAGNPFHNHFFLTAFGFELFGPNHDDADAVNLTTPEVIAGLEFFETVREILPVPTADLDWGNTHGEFVAGNVPYFISGPWSINDVVEDGDFDWGITTIPTINGNRPVTYSGNIIAVASAFTDHPELVRAVLEFMMSDEGLQIIYDYRGSIPALVDPSSINGLSDDPFQLGILAQAEYSHPMPIIPEMTFYWEAAGSMFTAVWEGLLMPEEAAESALDDFNAAITLGGQ